MSAVRAVAIVLEIVAGRSTSHVHPGGDVRVVNLNHTFFTAKYSDRERASSEIVAFAPLPWFARSEIF